jgi:hypothetical protein
MFEQHHSAGANKVYDSPIQRTDGRSVGNPRHTHPGPDASPRSTGASLEGQAHRLERYSVGAAHGCSMGRCPRPLSFLLDLSSALSAMGSLRSDEGSSRSSCLRSQSPRCFGCPRGHYRREPPLTSFRGAGRAFAVPPSFFVRIYAAKLGTSGRESPN